MKRIFLLLLSCSFYHLPAQFSCRGVVNVSLATDGTARLMPAFLTDYVPTGGERLSISPDRIFTCADIGTPITVTVTLTNGDRINTCTSIVNIEDKIIRPPLTLAAYSSVNVRLGLGTTMALRPEMFLVGPRCEGCTYTLEPSSVSCDNVGTPVVVRIRVRDQFCRENSVFSTLNVAGGIGCTIRMSMRFFRPNRIFPIGGRVPFFVELEQLQKKNDFKTIYSHFFISKDKRLFLKNSLYVGSEKLNANQKQKKTEVQIPQQLAEGQYYLIGVLSDSPQLKEAMESASTTSLEFYISGNGQGYVFSNTNSIQSINKQGDLLFIENFSGGEVRIFDLNGQLIKAVKTEKDTPVSINDLQKGILIIQAVSAGGEVQVHKVYNH